MGSNHTACFWSALWTGAPNIENTNASEIFLLLEIPFALCIHVLFSSQKKWSGRGTSEIKGKTLHDWLRQWVLQTQLSNLTQYSNLKIQFHHRQYLQKQKEISKSSDYWLNPMIGPGSDRNQECVPGRSSCQHNPRWEQGDSRPWSTRWNLSPEPSSLMVRPARKLSSLIWTLTTDKILAVQVIWRQL